jgi:hypothetical protein
LHRADGVAHCGAGETLLGDRLGTLARGSALILGHDGGDELEWLEQSDQECFLLGRFPTSYQDVFPPLAQPALGSRVDGGKNE